MHRHCHGFAAYITEIIMRFQALWSLFSTHNGKFELRRILNFEIFNFSKLSLNFVIWHYNICKGSYKKKLVKVVDLS